MAHRRFVFQKILQGLKFFRAHFWGACNANFFRVFCLSTAKKGLKRPRGPQNQKFNYVTLCPKPWHYRYRCHIFGTFFAQKAFVEPTTQNNIFWPFFDPKFLKKKCFFGLKKPTFKLVCGPQNFILHHFFKCTKYT